MDLKLKDKVAVVFAASKGLGKSAAFALAGEGCKLAICSRSEEAITKTAKEIAEQTGVETVGQSVDVQQKDQIEKFIKNVTAKFGTIDILVTNAGGPPVGSFEQTTDEEWHKW